MTDPHEGDVYRHPSAGEEVIIDYVTDAEVYLRVTDGAGGLIRACLAVGRVRRSGGGGAVSCVRGGGVREAPGAAGRRRVITLPSDRMTTQPWRIGGIDGQRFQILHLQPITSPRPRGRS